MLEDNIEGFILFLMNTSMIGLVIVLALCVGRL